MYGSQAPDVDFERPHGLREHKYGMFPISQALVHLRLAPCVFLPEACATCLYKMVLGYISATSLLPLFVFSCLLAFPTFLTTPAQAVLLPRVPEPFNASTQIAPNSGHVHSSSLAPHTFVQNGGMRDYVVYPKKPQAQAVWNIDRKINAIIGAEFVERKTSVAFPEFSNVLYWSFTANITKVRILKQALGTDVSSPPIAWRSLSLIACKAVVVVDEIVAETGPEIKVSDRSSWSNGSIELLPSNDDVIFQEDAWPDLRVISWPEGVPFTDIQSYAYSNSWDVKPIVYVIDEGLAPNDRVSPYSQIDAKGFL